LDFVDLLEDFAGVGFNVGSEVFKIPAVVGLVERKVLFEVGEFNIYFGQTDFHMHPDRNNGHKKCKQTDCLGKREAEYFPFFHEIGIRH